VTELLDPPPAPEARERLNAKDLKNQVLLLRPTLHDTIPGTKPNDRGEIKPWEFVEADVWLLDRQGITAHETGVRFSWWKAVDQLSKCIGSFVACKPVEQADNSVELVPLSGEAREVAEQAIKDIETLAVAAETQTQVADEDGPF
jgi:hypothetical protein